VTLTVEVCKASSEQLYIILTINSMVLKTTLMNTITVTTGNKVIIMQETRKDFYT